MVHIYIYIYIHALSLYACGVCSVPNTSYVISPELARPSSSVPSAGAYVSEVATARNIYIYIYIYYIYIYTLHTISVITCIVAAPVIAH